VLVWTFVEMDVVKDGPRWKAALREKARREMWVMGYVALVLWSAEWPLRRIECILWVFWLSLVVAVAKLRIQNLVPNGANSPSPHYHLRDDPHVQTPFIAWTRPISFSIRTQRRSSAEMSTAMENAEASFYLTQFIGKPLRIHVSDGRVFGGQMKCTDKVSIPVESYSLEFLLLPL